MAGPIRNDGRGWLNDAGQFRMRFLSGFTLGKLYADGHAAQADAFLDMAAAEGFNGARMFMVGPPGAWNECSVEDGLRGLDLACEAAKRRGLYLEDTVITGSKDFRPEPNWRDVIRRAEAICVSHGNAFIEGANEFAHASQSAAVHNPNNLRDWCTGLSVPWAIGAPDGELDEPVNGYFPGAGGSQICVHLNRGRDFWNQVRRVRELYAVYESCRAGVINGEPIGADEQAERGRRESNPVFYLTLGVLNRCFEVGGVFHSQPGLRCEPFGPNVLACARAFIRGSTFTEREEVFQYFNTGFMGGPIGQKDVDERIVRAYSFIANGSGYTTLIGLGQDSQGKYLASDAVVRLNPGWSFGETVIDEGGLRVLEVHQ